MNRNAGIKSYFRRTKILNLNVQAEKYKLIEWLVGLNDEQTLEELDSIRKRNQLAPLDAISPDQLVVRAEESNEAIKRGDVYDIEHILKDA